MIHPYFAIFYCTRLKIDNDWWLVHLILRAGDHGLRVGPPVSWQPEMGPGLALLVRGWWDFNCWFPGKFESPKVDGRNHGFLWIFPEINRNQSNDGWRQKMTLGCQLMINMSIKSWFSFSRRVNTSASHSSGSLGFHGFMKVYGCHMQSPSD